LTALVTPDGTRARRTADELIAADQEGAAVVLEALVRGRLVTVESSPGAEGPTYQIAHDVLVDGWDTLRSWRGNEVERGALLRRLRSAAGEWSRLGRPSEALWNRRQLAESAALDEAELGPTEAAFLQHSRRSARRRTLRQRVLAFGVPLLLGLGYGVARWNTQRHVSLAIQHDLDNADAILGQVRAQETNVEQLRNRAFAAFDHGRSDEGEAAWQLVLAANAQAIAGYAEAGQRIEQALALDGARRQTRRRFADFLEERARLAERDRRASERDELVQRMLAYDDDGVHRARWTAPARVTLTTVPVAAVSLQRFFDDGPHRRLTSVDRLGNAPLDLELEAGSYLFTVQAAGHPEVHYPLTVTRGESLRIEVPIVDSVAEGYVFIPPGRFLYGSDDPEEVRGLLNAQPLHSTTTGGYVIGKHEVTFAEWLDFLRALPPEESARRRPRLPVQVAKTATSGTLEVKGLSDGNFSLFMQPTTQPFTAAMGEAIHYGARTRHRDQNWLNLPVTEISWEDARAYAAWLDRTGRLSGARLCDEREWERAARGADDRLFPNGGRPDAEDANFDETYGREPLAFGPDEVGSHPASNSPFGVSDLAGNAWEFVTSAYAGETVVLRGGCWYQSRLDSRSNNREVGEPSLRTIVIGLRICASVHTSGTDH
jgi:formylglycine-generating enzyme required for sulfatase activity